VSAVRYHPVILEELARFGVFPTATTPPALVHEFISDLYRFELRRLRARQVRGDIPRAQYAEAVVAVRRRYPLVSIHPSQWVLDD
jgi:hypothetical protein